MPQFDSATFPSQIFWLSVCFAILCFVMKRFLLPRLAAGISARNQRLQEDLDRAAALTAELGDLRSQNLALVMQAHQKAHSLIHEAILEAHATRAERIAFFDEQIKAKTRLLRQQIDTKVHSILADREPLLSQVVTGATTRLLGQPFSKAQITSAIRAAIHQRSRG